jgi:hypothetical protein
VFVYRRMPALASRTDLVDEGMKEGTLLQLLTASRTRPRNNGVTEEPVPLDAFGPLEMSEA